MKLKELKEALSNSALNDDDEIEFFDSESDITTSIIRDIVLTKDIETSSGKSGLSLLSKEKEFNNKEERKVCFILDY